MAENRFVNAIALLNGGTAEGSSAFADILQEHWFKATCTVLCESRERKGHIDGDASSEFTSLGALNIVRASLAEPIGEDGENTSKLPVVLTELAELLPEVSFPQFRCVARGMLAALAVGHHFSTHEQLNEKATADLKECFQNYHAAWDLYAEPVRKLHGHAASDASPTRAGAILDAFAQQQLQTEVWWTQSNWLLVHRLLAFILGNEDTSASEEFPTNCVQMLLVKNTPENTYHGLTAPVTTSLHRECFGSCYLDPVALGLTILDEDMLNSLRIAARITRPNLLETNRSLRISPQPATASIVSLRGDSAGGLITLAALASADQHRLNRNASASFAISIPSPEKLKPNDQGEIMDLLREDVSFTTVCSESIEAKLKVPAFEGSEDAEPELNTVYLHADQMSGNEQFAEWTSRYKDKIQIKSVASPNREQPNGDTTP